MMEDYKMSSFGDRYKAACEALKRECEQQVLDGELSEEMANFRYYMVKEEILMEMPEEEDC